MKKALVLFSFITSTENIVYSRRSPLQFFLQRLLDAFSLNDVSGEEWAKFGYLLLVRRFNSTAYQAYMKALEMIPEDQLEARMEIATALVYILKNTDSSNFPNSREGAQKSIDIVRRYIELNLDYRMHHYIFFTCVSVVKLHQMEASYSFLIKVGLDLMELYYRSNDFEKVVEFWLVLYPIDDPVCDKWDEPADESGKTPSGIFQKLIEEKKEGREKLLSLMAQNPKVILMQAYALYLNGQIDSAILRLFRYEGRYGDFTYDRCPPPSWLMELGRKNFKAALACSLFLKIKDDLVPHFLRLLKVHPKSTFFIYHNLAVRLFFCRSTGAASYYLKKALEINSLQPESRALKRMIEEKKEKRWQPKSSQNELLITEKT